MVDAGRVSAGATGRRVVVVDPLSGPDQRLIIEEIRAKVAGFDHGGVDPERRELAGQRLGEGLDGELGRAVNPQPG